MLALDLAQAGEREWHAMEDTLLKPPMDIKRWSVEGRSCLTRMPSLAGWLQPIGWLADSMPLRFAVRHC